MVEVSFHNTPHSTMPFGFATTLKRLAVNDTVSLHGTNSEAVEVNTHRFMRTDRNPQYVFGVTRAYNVATKTDITQHILKVKQYSIDFEPSYVTNGDLIELDIYLNYKSILDDYSAGDGKLSDITSDWIEQLYRFVSNLDRADFGNYSPPFEPVFDYMDSTHDSTKYTYHPRIFFGCNGYYNTDTITGGSAVSGGTLTHTPRTIINYSPGSVNTVGGFIGDPVYTSKVGGNENYSVIPSPMYLTEMTFFCKLKNSSYVYEEAEAIRLNISVDGQSRAFGTAPNYVDTNGDHPINLFGSDSDLLLSFSGDPDYSGLPPCYKYGKPLDDGAGGTAYYYIFRIPIGRTRINSGITVSATLLSMDDGVQELTDYLFTVGGIIPVSWKA